MPRRLVVPAVTVALLAACVGVGYAEFGPSSRPADVDLGSSTTVAPTSPLPQPAPEEGAPAEAVPTLLGDVLPTDVEVPAVPADLDELEAEAEADDGPDYDVAAVQQQLTEQRYYVGAVDGEAGPATTSAIMAFQKVNGLSADGVVGPATQAALAAPAEPSLRGGAADRIEVDLTKQVLYLVEDGALSRIVPVSSGSGETYETSGGGTARSLTPTGTYRIERNIRGVREAQLGTLYDPMYFYRGWAIHGSNSVPAYPASHGCVRVTRADAIWLFDRATIGMQVSLYGGTHTFGQGDSSEAGTSTPAGDTAADTAPSPAPAPEEPAPSLAAPAEPEPAPEPEPEPDPEPEPSSAPEAPASEGPPEEGLPVPTSG